MGLELIPHVEDVNEHDIPQVTNLYHNWRDQPPQNSTTATMSDKYYHEVHSGDYYKAQTKKHTTVDENYTKMRSGALKIVYRK